MEQLIKTYLLIQITVKSVLVIMICGIWINEIFDEDDQVIKRDIAKNKHNKKTNCIIGTVRRETPYQCPSKKWNCSGIITDDHIIVSFWANDLIKSDGCVYATFVSDYTYEGCYLKEAENEIRKVKIRLAKQPHKLQ